MRRLGAQLRKIREERGLTLDEAADLLKLSKSALARMETAQVTTRRHEVEYLTYKYGVTDEGLRDSLIGLAGAGRSKDWVKRYGSLVRPSGDYVRLEQDSSLIRTFQAILVPGLLQTPEYARTIMGQIKYDPPPNLESVAYRMARQEVLTRPDAAQLKAVIGEAALRQQLGGTEIMRSQLQHLLEMYERANVSMRVLRRGARRDPTTPYCRN
jgi:transcriptional regulator with XRE-family HTH domain